MDLWFSGLAQSDPGGTRELIDKLARTPLSQVLLFVFVLTVLRIGMAGYLHKTPPHKRSGAYGLVKIGNEIFDAFVYAGVFVFMIIRPFAIQAFLIPSGSMWPTLYVNDFIVANKAIYRFSDPVPGDIVVFRPPKTAVAPSDLDEQGEAKVDFIKRCIGTPGDLIEVKKGVLYRNGVVFGDDYRHYSECMDADVNHCVNFRALTDQEKADLTMASFKLIQYRGKVSPYNYTEYDANYSRPRANSMMEMPYAVAPDFQFDDQRLGMSFKDAPAVKVPKGYYLMMGDNRNGSFDSRGWGLVPRESIIGRSEVIWLPFSRWRLTR